MRVVEETYMFWERNYLGIVKRINNDRNGNPRFRVTLYVKKDNVILSDIRTSYLELRKRQFVLPIMNCMYKEYKLMGKN